MGQDHQWRPEGEDLAGNPRTPAPARAAGVYPREKEEVDPVRSMALSHATSLFHTRPGTKTDDVIKLAKAYEKFLRGES